MNYNFNPNEALNKIPQKFRKRLEPKIDTLASKVVGKKVLARDPRLINLVIEFKRKKKDLEVSDNFFQNPEFVKKLRKTFNSNKL